MKYSQWSFFIFQTSKFVLYNCKHLKIMMSLFTLHIMDIGFNWHCSIKVPNLRVFVYFHDHWYVIYLHMYIILAGVLSVLKHQLKCATCIWKYRYSLKKQAKNNSLSITYIIITVSTSLLLLHIVVNIGSLIQQLWKVLQLSLISQPASSLCTYNNVSSVGYVSISTVKLSQRYRKEG